MEKAKSYRSTYVACATCSLSQAVTANLTAVLYVSFMRLYGFGVWQLGVLVGVNYVSQLTADLVLSAMIDRISHRKPVLIALALSAAGLALMGAAGFVPAITSSSAAMYIALVGATVVFSFAGGMLEVMTSPIADAIPKKNDGGGALTVIHSCYAFGQAAMVAITAVVLRYAGDGSWKYISLCWTALPLVAFFLFTRCPIVKKPVVVSDEKRSRLTPYMLVAMAAIFFSAGTEMMMNQYVSTMATVSLGFDKFTSDMLGMCVFAVMLGAGRLGYGMLDKKLDLGLLLVVSGGLALGCYLTAGLAAPAFALAACMVCGLAVALLWPGTLVLASRRGGGAWTFAVLAVAGDLGGSVLPAAAGAVAEAVETARAFAWCSFMPLLCFICFSVMYVSDRKARKVQLLGR